MYEGPLRPNVKSVKTSILVLKVIQGHCFRCQSKPVYDFLLAINCNLGPIVSEIWRLLGRNPYPRGRYSRSRSSSKVIDLGLNGKPICDFRLVINLTLALSRTVSEIWQVIGSKSQNFPTPSHLGPSIGVTPMIFLEKRCRS